MSITDTSTEPINLTITMLGTGQHRGNVSNLMTHFNEQIQTGPNDFKYLIDGPGGAPLVNDPKNPMLGTYKINNFDIKNGEINPEKIPKNMGFLMRQRGLLAGTGYKDAMLEIVQLVLSLKEKYPNRPINLNMIGFSRGADTILRAANILNGFYDRSEVKCNLLCIDPVPGFMRQGALKARNLPPNSDMKVIVMQDELRSLFESQHIQHIHVQDPTTSHIEYRFLQGFHSQGLKSDFDPRLGEDEQDAKTNTIDTNLLTRSIMLEFAEQNNIRHLPIGFVERIGSSDVDIKMADSKGPLSKITPLEAYTNMRANQAHYASYSKKLYGMYSHHRDVLDNKRDYILHGEKYFYDRTHMYLFQQMYPSFFNHYFQHGGKEGENKTKVFEDIERMKNQKGMQRSLLTIGIDINKISNAKEVGPPQGVHAKIDIYDDPHLMKLWRVAQSIAHPVLQGYDKSIDKKVARTLLERVDMILKNDMSYEAKRNNLYKLFNAMLNKYPNNESFSLKLSGAVQDASLQCDLLLKYLNELSGKVEKNSFMIEYIDKTIRSVIQIQNNKTLTNAEKTNSLRQEMLSLHNNSLRSDTIFCRRLRRNINTYFTFHQPKKDMADMVIDNMVRYQRRFKWGGLFHDKPLSQKKANIAAKLINSLNSLKEKNRGNDIQSINQLISNAFLESKEARSSTTKALEEGQLERYLRWSMMQLTTFDASFPIKEPLEKSPKPVQEVEVGTSDFSLRR